MTSGNTKQSRPGHSRPSIVILGAQLFAKYWFKPFMWPAIWREGKGVIGRKIWPGNTDLPDKTELSRKLAQEWCELSAIESAELAHLLPFRFVLTDPEKVFPEIFESSRARVSECPVKLGGAGNLSLLYSLVLSLDTENVVETGVAYGWSSLAILLALKQRGGGTLSSVDMPYLTIMNDDWVGIAVPKDLKSPWNLFRMADREGLPRAIREAEPVDLAHYDSDKSPAGRAFGYEKIWQALRPGGIFISDDISDNLAFKAFSEKVDRKPIIVRHVGKYQGILIK